MRVKESGIAGTRAPSLLSIRVGLKHGFAERFTRRLTLKPLHSAWSFLSLLVLPGLAPADRLFVVPKATIAYYQVDLKSGEVTFGAIEQYPEIISYGPAEIMSGGRMILAGFDAGQRRGLWIHDPAGVRLQPVSGYTDPNTTTVMGEGPMFGSEVRDIVWQPGGDLFLVTRPRPTEPGVLPPLELMAVDPASGNRRVISRAGEDPVGEGPAFENARDAFLARDGRRLLVLDAFDGLFGVDLVSGDRVLVASGGEFGLQPSEVEELADGRLIGLLPDPDTDALFTLHPETKEVRLLSGEFGGNSAGAGPMFGFIYSLAVDARGTIYVYDAQFGAVWRVDPVTGDRRIVAGGPGSTTEPLPGPEDEPSLTSAFTLPPSGFMLN